jgi:hypothetical protein
MPFQCRLRIHSRHLLPSALLAYGLSQLAYMQIEIGIVRRADSSRSS